MRKLILCCVLASAAGVIAQEQGEKPVDKNSERISIYGCLKGRVLTAIRPSTDQPVSTRVAAGRVFRLSGSKDVMDEVKKRDGSAVAVTGLVKKSALSAPQGVSMAGGRVRVGGMPQNTDPTQIHPSRDPLANVDMLDAESVRPVNEACPAK